MDDRDTPSILAVGAKLANLRRAKSTDDIDGDIGLVEVDSGVRAFELLRALRFDLIAIGPGITDMTPGVFAERLRAARSWQKWVLVADETLDSRDEMMSRAMGALAVLDGPDAWKSVVQLARQVRRKNPAAVPNLRIRPAAV